MTGGGNAGFHFSTRVGKSQRQEEGWKGEKEAGGGKIPLEEEMKFLDLIMQMERNFLTYFCRQKN